MVAQILAFGCGAKAKSGYNAPVMSKALSRKGAGPSDAALVVAARANESWAKEALFRRYASLVNGLAFRVIGRDSDLDDLVQDSFTEAWRCLHRLENPQAFASWISAIVVRTAHKMLRRRKIARFFGLAASESTDIESALSSSAPPDVHCELRAIYKLVETLPTSTRIAFVLRRVDGLGLEEIADMMQLSLATVKRRIQEAERLLALSSNANEQGPEREVYSHVSVVSSDRRGHG